jgi:hypothetical protein
MHLHYCIQSGTLRRAAFRSYAERGRSVELPGAFCWSKMGSESGERLAGILWRKELERKAGGGLFVWGVGTSLGRGLTELLEGPGPHRVVFSEMRSRPKQADVSPGRPLLWLSYWVGSCERELPPHCLVTSRQSTGSGRAKESHYALMCRAAHPISHEPIGHLDETRLVNLASGKPIGFSQVTATVRQAGRPLDGGPRIYPINFVAEFEGPGQVRLARHAPVERVEIEQLYRMARDGDTQAWCRGLEQLKSSTAVLARAPCTEASTLRNSDSVAHAF